MIEIRELAILDYDAVMTLWRETPGVGLSAADNREAIAAYLLRNPGLSFAAWDGPRLVGAVLCGHDGRRGYLHHLAVAPAYRRQHLGFELAERCPLLAQVRNREMSSFRLPQQRGRAIILEKQRLGRTP